MKQYKILKDFDGCQDGTTVTNFKKDSTAGLSDSLAKTALEEKWAEPAKEEKKPARGKGAK